jgi:hypothetical protein
MRRCVGRGRHKWTVNYKFVSEQFFVSPPLSMALLACTIGTMGLFGFTRWAKPRTADAYVRTLGLACATRGEPNQLGRRTSAPVSTESAVQSCECGAAGPPGGPAGLRLFAYRTSFAMRAMRCGTIPLG